MLALCYFKCSFNLNLPVAKTLLSHKIVLFEASFKYYKSFSQHCIFLTSNTLNIILAMFKLSVLHFYKTEFSDIIVYAQKHFWHINYNDDEKILFAECRNFCKLWTVFILFATQSSLSFYAIVPISGKLIHRLKD